MTIRISLKERLPLLRQAYIDNRLGCQHGSVDGCRYRYPGTDRVCGIGAMILDSEYRPELDHPLKKGELTTVGKLAEKGDFEFDSQEELMTAMLIQSEHDNAVLGRPESNFKLVLNEVLVKYGLEPVS